MRSTCGILACAWVLAAGVTACGGGSDSATDAGAGGGAAGGAGGTTGAGGGAGGSASGGALTDVPFEGELPALPPGAEVDTQSYLPFPPGGIWRYRKRSAMPQMPEAVTQGGESTVSVHPDPDDPERSEVERKTVTIFDLPATADAPAQKVNQTLKETFIIYPADGQVGPRFKFKALDIEEREVGTGKFVRTLNRTYDPPYTLIEDAWRVGIIRGQISERPHVTERLQEHGQEMPTEQMYIADVRVEAADHDETLLMEAQYREKVRQIEVFDDVSQQATRTLWVQAGVGIVQWVYRDATNLTFTLVETNVEPAPAP